MLVWRPIAKAPQDGTAVMAATESNLQKGRFPYPMVSRYLEGQWCANFGKEDWRPYDPQPTHYLDEALPKRCLVKGCPNTPDQGMFIGDLCMPCHEMITSGKIHPRNLTFIGDLSRALALREDGLRKILAFGVEDDGIGITLNAYGHLQCRLIAYDVFRTNKEHEFDDEFGKCKGCGKYVEQLINERFCTGGQNG